MRHRNHLLIPGGPLTALLAAVTTISLWAAPAAAQPPAAEIVRLAGPTRLETAIGISTDAFPSGDAGAVVLARADAFPDALAGGPLAAAKGGPLLLTPTTSLAPIVADEIQRVLPAGGMVHLLGGEAALSAQVAADVTALGYEVVRIAGPSRYDTALAIAREAAAEPAFITVASGNEFPDAVIGGALAAAFSDSVMVLSNGDSLPSAVSQYLQDNADAEFGAVTVGAAAASAYPEAFTITGADPAERSVVAAEIFYGEGDQGPGGVAIASVEAFPDGLAGGSHAFRSGRVPLLLTPSDSLSPHITDYVRGLTPATPSYVYGGVAAVAEPVVDALRAAWQD